MIIKKNKKKVQISSLRQDYEILILKTLESF